MSIAPAESRSHAALAAWNETAPLALVGVEPQGEVFFVNAAARRLLTDPEAPLRIEHGRLAPTEVCEGEAFARMLSPSGTEPDLIAAGGRSRRVWLVASQRLDHDLGVMLLLRRAWEPSFANLRAAELAGLFRLTGAEAEVTRRLLSAQSPEAIASALDIKVGTVRTHIRNIYVKLDVQSREALFMRCLPLVWLD